MEQAEVAFTAFKSKNNFLCRANARLNSLNRDVYIVYFIIIYLYIRVKITLEMAQLLPIPKI